MKRIYWRELLACVVIGLVLWGSFWVVVALHVPVR
jgi:hypothetical protein